MIKVLNAHHFPDGLPPGTWPAHRPYPLGNPFRSGIDDDPIGQYKKWLWEGIKKQDGRWHELVRLKRLHLLRQDLSLACWCDPKPCHAQVVVDAINWIQLPDIQPALALIGPRKISDELRDNLVSLSGQLAQTDWVMRSGGAPGADQAWMSQAKNGEIHLPWINFERGHHPVDASFFINPNQRALCWAQWAVPYPLSQGVHKLHARNWHILLGKDLSQAVSKVLYAHEHGPEAKGGTANALNVARLHGIEIQAVGPKTTLADLGL